MACSTVGGPACTQLLVHVLCCSTAGTVASAPSLRPAPSTQVQHYLALDAHQFVGNSVAVSDALVIMERWRAGRYATYYNGGNIPLEAHMPLFP